MVGQYGEYPKEAEGMDGRLKNDVSLMQQQLSGRNDRHTLILTL